MDGIFVLFRNGKIEAYSEYEETIERLFHERPDEFDIKYIEGELADRLKKSNPELEMVDSEAMTFPEWEMMMYTLQQLPIDIQNKMDMIAPYLSYLKVDEVDILLNLVYTIKAKAEEIHYSDDDEYNLWNIDVYRKNFL